MEICASFFPAFFWYCFFGSLCTFGTNFASILGIILCHFEEQGLEVSTPRKPCACRSDQGSGGVENVLKCVKNQKEKRSAPAEWKIGGFGFILASFWEAPGPILEAKGRPKTKQNFWYFFRVSRGCTWGLPGRPGAARGLPPISRASFWLIRRDARRRPGLR